MATIRCPHCGSPVMVRGNRWECGWCGDSGALKRPDTVSISVSVSVVYQIDLAEAWDSLKAALATLFPDQNAALRPLLGKVLAYTISDGIQHLNARPKAQKLQELEDFLAHTPDMHRAGTVHEMLKSMTAGTLYAQEAELSEQVCGTFWKEGISCLTQEQYYDGEPDGLSDLLHELACVYAYFGGAEGEESEAEQDHQNKLRDAFYLHWREKTALHPDAPRARRLLAHGEFPPCEDVCRDILVAEFPEEVADYTLEDLADGTWNQIIDDVLERDATKGIIMWRTLLDTAAPCLKNDPDTAETLLRDWDALDSPSFYTAQAFLDALEDHSFSKQVFQSAFIENLQRDLLTVCREFDRMELGRHCLDLALENPYLSESWERRLRQALTPGIRYGKTRKLPQPADVPPEGDRFDNGTVFYYCTVMVAGVGRAYSYLTGGLPLKIGDWVEVPFGKNGLPRRGQIVSVTDCTRWTAPWPPEQTKTVLRILEAPEEKPDGSTA